MKIDDMNNYELIMFAGEIISWLEGVSKNTEEYDDNQIIIESLIEKASYVLPKIGLSNDCFKNMRYENIKNYHLMLEGINNKIEHEFFKIQKNKNFYKCISSEYLNSELNECEI